MAILLDESKDVRSLLARWHLLSLDAPTVATLWTWFIAHCAGEQLSAVTLASMFVAVWLLYAADRLLDTRHLGADERGVSINADLELRHHFHHHNRTRFLAAIVFAGIALAAMLPFLPVPALRLYALLGALLISWLLVIHTRVAASTRLPKELAVGIFFSAAVFIPTVAALPELRVMLLGPALLFGTLCSLNCIFLYAWEHPAGSKDAHWTTRFALARMRTEAWSLTLGGFALSVLFRDRSFSSNILPLCAAFAGQTSYPLSLAPLASACFLSALLLLLLDKFREHISAVHLRAAADLALLTPVCWLLVSVA